MNVFPTIEACQQACEQAPENPPPIFPTQPTDNIRPPSVDMGTLGLNTDTYISGNRPYKDRTEFWALI